MQRFLKFNKEGLRHELRAGPIKYNGQPEDENQNALTEVFQRKVQN